MRQNKHNIISSSSAGNAIIYHEEILVDAGVAYNKIHKYIRDIKYVLLTHWHGDHFQLSTIARIQTEKPGVLFVVPEYLVSRLEMIKLRNVLVVQSGRKYKIGKYKIEVVELFHDVPNVGYKIYTSDYKLLHATDTNTIAHVDAHNFDLLAVECNHDELEILRTIQEKEELGIFSYESRSKDTHLSEQKWSEFIDRMKGPNTEVLKLHMSSSYVEKENEI